MQMAREWTVRECMHLYVCDHLSSSCDTEAFNCGGSCGHWRTPPANPLFACVSLHSHSNTNYVSFLGHPSFGALCITNQDSLLMNDSHEHEDYSSRAEFLSGSLTRVILASVASIANSIVVVLIVRTRTMHSQPNYLLANLAAADLLMAVGYMQFSLVNWSTGFNPTRFQCLAMLYPIIVATVVSICSLVPLSHYRIKLVKAYSMSQGHMDITEPWKLKSSLTTLWVLSLVGSAFCFLNVDLTAHLEVCVLPLAVSNDYLVPFFLFIITVCVVVASEYIKIVMAVISGTSIFSSSDKGESISVKWKRYVEFDPAVTRVVLVIAGAFVSCWLPFLVAICYYLIPYNSPDSVAAHSFTHWVTVLPLVHSTIDPFLYSLSEKDLRSLIWTWMRNHIWNRSPPSAPPQINLTPHLAKERERVAPPTISSSVAMFNRTTNNIPTSDSNSTQLTSFSFPNDAFEYDEVIL